MGPIGAVSPFEFDLDDFVVTFTTLTDDQFDAFSRVRGRPCYYRGVVAVAQWHGAAAGVMRFYGSLDALQQQKAQGEGIGVRDLNPGQQAAFAACLDQVSTTEVPEPQVAAATLRLAFTTREDTTRTSDKRKWVEKRAVFTFALANGDQEQVRVILAHKPVEASGETAAPR